MNTQCPDPTCDEGQIPVPQDVQAGDVLECPECAAEVEVLSTNPLQIELIVEEK